MTAAAPPRPSTSTARKRTRGAVRRIPVNRRDRLIAYCDRCDQVRTLLLADWLCQSCRDQGARRG